MRILGFMTGTSLDAIDMAILETDGERITAFGPAGEGAMPEALRTLALEAIVAGRAWKRGEPEPNLFHHLSEEIAKAHAEAADAFLRAQGLTFADIDLIGFHGQTVMHEAPKGGVAGRTRQLGDGQLLARLTGRPVAFDFRTADVAAGGQGAPLAPIYHVARAEASGLKPPLAVLNIGGVANITAIDAEGRVSAFDTGPGNGLIDQWVERHDLGRFDEEGRLAASGTVNVKALSELMTHPFFQTVGPKSLDRYDFTLGAVEGLSPADGAATLAAFTAETVALGLAQTGVGPAAIIACGGGRKNLQILREISLRTRRPVITAERAGWRGDAIEAEAFAYLAARTLKGLPISFPGTTGVGLPMSGGMVVQP
ncbi:MAG: anhydro-N-acetylmuramic acid kinase [Pseudomonadota bacterium]|nr:anhydro-N-acetylmuramic acid kinase [Pseudomonadota bacterium]